MHQTQQIIKNYEFNIIYKKKYFKQNEYIIVGAQGTRKGL